jgi:EAL domain-containing protein (putative c-di-GMP-specific phosphodiesterase class I)
VFVTIFAAVQHRSFGQRLDSDKMRRALASALIEFARQTDSKIVAEGIETSSELKTLRTLGAHAAQGYFLAKPLPIEKFCQLASRRR